MGFSKENSTSWFDRTFLKYWVLIFGGGLLYAEFTEDYSQFSNWSSFLEYAVASFVPAFAVAVYEMWVRRVREGRINGPIADGTPDPVADGTKAVLAAREQQEEKR